MEYKNEIDKELICKQCGQFLDKDDLKNGDCPNCETDEDIYLNIED